VLFAELKSAALRVHFERCAYDDVCDLFEHPAVVDFVYQSACAVPSNVNDRYLSVLEPGFDLLNNRERGSYAITHRSPHAAAVEPAAAPSDPEAARAHAAAVELGRRQDEHVPSPASPGGPSPKRQRESK
jgi:hypothetical protein